MADKKTDDKTKLAEFLQAYPTESQGPLDHRLLYALDADDLAHFGLDAISDQTAWVRAYRADPDFFEKRRRYPELFVEWRIADPHPVRIIDLPFLAGYDPRIIKRLFNHTGGDLSSDPNVSAWWDETTSRISDHVEETLVIRGLSPEEEQNYTLLKYGLPLLTDPSSCAAYLETLFGTPRSCVEQLRPIITTHPAPLEDTITKALARHNTALVSDQQQAVQYSKYRGFSEVAAGITLAGIAWYFTSPSFGLLVAAREGAASLIQSASTLLPNVSAYQIPTLLWNALGWLGIGSGVTLAAAGIARTSFAMLQSRPLEYQLPSSTQFEKLLKEEQRKLPERIPPEELQKLLVIEGQRQQKQIDSVRSSYVTQEKKATKYYELTPRQSIKLQKTLQQHLDAVESPPSLPAPPLALPCNILVTDDEEERSDDITRNF